MIQPCELRIGNAISPLKIGTTIREVLRIDGDKVMIQFGSELRRADDGEMNKFKPEPKRYYDCEQIYPVQITQAILERVGAVFPHDDQRLQIGTLCFKLDRNGDGYFLKLTGPNYQEEISEGIDSLHQLQNVYFDLTGSSLPLSDGK